MLHDEDTSFRKKIFSVALTLFFFLISFWIVKNLLVLKSSSGILNLDYWKKEENAKTDILFMGNSALADNIDLAELWQEYGIAGYDMGAGGIDMPNAYYRLKEAAKYHEINMVVLDVRGCIRTEEYTDPGTLWGSIATLKWSLNKLYGVRCVASPEDRAWFFMSFPLYHDRYQNLSRDDYLYSNWAGNDNKGQWEILYGNSFPAEIASAKDIVSYRNIDEKQKYYFKAILEYCQENGIKILVIKTPEFDRITDQPVYNAVEMITEEYKVPYLNMNLYDDEIGITASDCANNKVHLNVKGARKCADFLGEYLKNNYQLPDHRGDDAYVSWDRFASNWENLYLRAITDEEDYFNELLRDNKKVVAIPYHLTESTSEDYQKLQEQLAAISHSDWDREDILYGEDCAGKFDFGSNEVIVTKNYDSCKITINGKSGIEVQQPGLFLIVYDDVNDEIADIVEFERDNGYALKHLYSL